MIWPALFPARRKVRRGRVEKKLNLLLQVTHIQSILIAQFREPTHRFLNSVAQRCRWQIFNHTPDCRITHGWRNRNLRSAERDELARTTLIDDRCAL